jgi:hypothetical protein
MNLANRFSMITAFMLRPGTPAPASPCAVIAVSARLALPVLDRWIGGSLPREIGRPCLTRGYRPLAVP